MPKVDSTLRRELKDFGVKSRKEKKKYSTVTLLSRC